MKSIINEFQDDVFIVIKPNPLWNYSIQQIQSLYISNEFGLFEEMLTEQFKLQKPRQGLSLDQIKEIFEKIGLDSKLLIQRIKNADYLKQILKENQKVRKIGINSAPTLLLNGKTISPKSRNVKCIRELLN